MKSKIIGIVGASGSGKTTVARALAKDGLLVSQDNYYRDLPDDVNADDWNFDDPAVLDLEQLAHDLAALKRGEPVEAPQYHFATHKRLSETITLKPAPLIIVEGLFLFMPVLRDFFDFKLFIDVPLETCLERRIARDVVERGRTEDVIRRRWTEQVEPMFRQYVEPTKAVADLLLHPASLGSLEWHAQISNVCKSIQ